MLMAVFNISIYVYVYICAYQADLVIICITFPLPYNVTSS